MDLVILGASGSIGTQTIDVIKNNKKKWTLKGFSVGNKTFYIDEILKEFKDVTSICLKNKKDYLNYKNKYPSIKFFYGDKGLIKLIKYNKNATVLNALVGFVGLNPSIVSLKLNRTLLLANKESLVCGGNLINKILKRRGKIYPIDSEHVAIAKCLYNENISDVNEIIITASGGPFFNLNREELKNVTLKDALNHPTWKMGNKITIDSATMMNKGFEVIEAYYLFSLPLDKIHVLLHDESLIHALIRMKDGSLIADMATNDMRIPISYALYEGKYHSTNVPKLDLESILSLHFRKMDPERYPSLNLAYDALRKGKTYLCVLNASNEEANLAFREGRLKFNQIEKVVASCLNNHQVEDNFTYQDLQRIDYQTRLESRKIIENLK